MTITIPKSDYRWLDATPAETVTQAGDTVVLFSMAPLALLATQYGMSEFIHDVAVFSVFWLVVLVVLMFAWHALTAPQQRHSPTAPKQYSVGVETPQNAPTPATDGIEWTVSASGARVPIRRKTNAQK